ncbi:reticulon-4-interacting protein 1 homolog, mitochondrial-like isoform X2 [Contarinia nasturtii]|uniref:reticulon-4-interacting protein 1 homolog, mitochondrial-like isoform X2 n=1 Tax=Contarinia nasturtii TaxID=265458 RepID=UPI0012D3FAC2|nr:reticulon-4-interacting protein 1 homolog, mitochondrial-like isoform X2 [Contarinia nasturtii]
MNFKSAIYSVFTFFYGYIQITAEYWKSIACALFNNIGGDIPSSSHENIETSKQMKGWKIDEYDGIAALQFSDQLKMPAITSANDVLIEVYSTSVNPIDQLMIEGYGANVMNTLRWISKIKEFPLISGREFCGVVKEKGKSVRDDIQIGSKVWGLVPAHMPGSLAEYVVVNQNTITLKPEGISDIEAAGVLYAGLTAWSSLFISGLAGGVQGAKTSKGGGRGLRLCILGASGGVGTIAVQMAKAEGMIVTATCSTNSVQTVKDLGADYVIDYRTEDLNKAFRGLSFDIILDAAGQGPEYARTLPWKFEQYITLTPPLLNNTDTNGVIIGSIKSAITLLQSNIQTVFGYGGLLKWGFFVPASQGIQYFKRLVESGKLKPVIDSTFEFNSTKEAFEKVARGHLRGKVLVKVKQQ